MKLLHNFKNVIYKLDFFYTAEVLRFQEEPQYKTLCGGVMSMLIILLLLVAFYNKVIDTFGKIIISSAASSLSADDPKPYNISTMPGYPFMFGAQLWHYNLSTQTERYFDVRLEQGYYNTGQKNASMSQSIPLEPCTLEHWAAYPNIQKSFSRLSIDTWMCMPLNLEVEIKGKYASEVSQLLEVSISQCTNSSQWTVPCAPQTTIDQLFANDTNFFFTLYFINPIINADSQEFLEYYIEDSNYIIFSATRGEECQLLMEDFTINTDESIIPLSEIRTDSGGIVTRNCIKNGYSIDPNAPLYATFFFYKSPISRTIQRNFQKIDEILSYIGGLFGTIAICLFLVNMYNGYSFEILMGSYLFRPDDGQKSDLLKKYNFFYFLSQLFYAVLGTLGCQPPWLNTRLFYECREQMVKQLDILYLIKRINFLQRAMQNIMSEHQLRAIHLFKNKSLHEARLSRQRFKWNQHTFIYKLGQSKQRQLCEKMTIQKTQQNKKNNPNQYNSKNHQNSGTFIEVDIKDQSIQHHKAQNNHEISLSSDSQSDCEDPQNIVKDIERLKKETRKYKLSKKIWDKLANNIKDTVNREKPFFENFEQKQQYQMVDDKDGAQLVYVEVKNNEILRLGSPKRQIQKSESEQFQMLEFNQIKNREFCSVEMIPDDL